METPLCQICRNTHIKGHRGQNSGSGQFSRRSQTSQRKSRMSRRKANQPLLESAVAIQSQQLQLESVETTVSCRFS